MGSLQRLALRGVRVESSKELKEDSKRIWRGSVMWSKMRLLPDQSGIGRGSIVSIGKSTHINGER